MTEPLDGIKRRLDRVQRTNATDSFLVLADAFIDTDAPRLVSLVDELQARLGISELLRVEDVGDASKRQHNAEVQRDELQDRLDNVLALCKDQRFDLADTAAIRRAASPSEDQNDCPGPITALSPSS